MKRAFPILSILAGALLAMAAPLEAMETLRQYLPATEATPAPSPAENAAEQAAATPEATPAAEGEKLPPVVRVNVASQSFNFTQPWRKNQPVLRQGLGVVLMDGRILVTAELVNNHTYVELEKPETALKAAAQVEAVDYDANLALLAAPAAEFLQSISGARLDEAVAVGDRVDILQLEANGTPVRTPATVTTIEVGPYPVDENAFLVFKLSAPLQSRENSFTVPVFKEDRLVGLVMRCSGTGHQSLPRCRRTRTLRRFPARRADLLRHARPATPPLRQAAQRHRGSLHHARAARITRRDRRHQGR